MENSDLLRRAEDLLRRCEKNDTLTFTAFLSPVERVQVERWAKTQPGCRLLVSGGHPECERCVAFFLPDYLEAEWLPLDEYIRVFELMAPFGCPGHRDYLGALLGMGIGRERLGDIWVRDNRAIIFCLPGVEKHLLSIDRVGRDTVRARSLSLDEVPNPERRVKPKSFSVQSLRLDAVVGGLFDLSRSCLISPAARQPARWKQARLPSTMRSVTSAMLLSVKGTSSLCAERERAALSASAALRAKADSL